MNFKFTKAKTIVSIILGGFFSLVAYMSSLFGGLGYPPNSLTKSVIIWLIWTIIIYIIWSLIQKKK